MLNGLHFRDGRHGSFKVLKAHRPLVASFTPRKTVTPKPSFSASRLNRCPRITPASRSRLIRRHVAGWRQPQARPMAPARLPCIACKQTQNGEIRSHPSRSQRQRLVGFDPGHMHQRLDIRDMRQGQDAAAVNLLIMRHIPRDDGQAHIHRPRKVWISITSGTLRAGFGMNSSKARGLCLVQRNAQRTPQPHTPKQPNRSPPGCPDPLTNAPPRAACACRRASCPGLTWRSVLPITPPGQASGSDHACH